MKRILGFVAGLVTVLTLIALSIDVPGKIKSGYETVLGIAPDVKFDALFANQDVIYVSQYTDDKSRGSDRFVWPSVYEIQNPTDKDITIIDIENITPEVRGSDHVIQLKQVSAPKRIIAVYDNFQQLTSDKSTEQGTTERFPYTIKAGAKKYIKVFGDYIVTDRGSTLFCRSKENCARLLLLSLGISVKNGEKLPCAISDFQTKVSLSGYKSRVTDQKAALLIEGCELNLDKLINENIRR